VLRLDAVTAQAGADVLDLGGNAVDDAVAERLQEMKGDLSRDEITQAIESMNDKQKDALVALFWIGRGDSGTKARRDGRGGSPGFQVSVAPDGPFGRGGGRLKGRFDRGVAVRFTVF
jgi:hypothetical protein